MQKAFKTLALALLVSLLINCSSTEPSAEQEKHLETFAILLLDEETKDTVAVLYNEKDVTGATSKTAITLSLAKAQTLDVKLLCGETTPIAASALKECDLKKLAKEESESDDHKEDEHDDHKEDEHDDHKEDEHDDHKEDEHDDHEDSSEFSLVATLSEEGFVKLDVEADHFEVTLTPLKKGNVVLDIQVNHGGHADITDKKFQLSVQ